MNIRLEIGIASMAFVAGCAGRHAASSPSATDAHNAETMNALESTSLDCVEPQQIPNTTLHQPTSPDTPPERVVTRDSIEVFPHVRLDRESRTVDFDAVVPPRAFAVLYLEQVVCTRGTRDHEVLAITDAKPSEIQAAIMMLGLEPGSPGSWEWKDKKLIPIPPKGPALDVTFVVDRDGTKHEESPLDWITLETTGKTLRQTLGASSRGAFVLAGSGFVVRGPGLPEEYEADGSGTLIGLTTFGTETIAFRNMHSPETSVEAPVFVLREDATPPGGTPVVVRIRPAE